MKRRNLIALVALSCLLVAGVGAATSYLSVSPEATGLAEKASLAPSRSGIDGEVFGNLEDYARSIETGESVAAAGGGKLLPDVSTMIERLAARLEAAPDDIKGWRMLGWSYFNTGLYGEAAAAYAKAVALDPSSAELKRSYEEAQAMAAGSPAEKAAKAQSMQPDERGPEIRAMVDGLARRLESTPRDVDGWTRLMRSRVVLGEREVATAALRKALDIFKDDSAASGRISAAAIELGLTNE